MPGKSGSKYKIKITGEKKMNTFSFCFPTGNESFVGHVWQAGNDNFNLPFLEGLHLPYTTQSVFFFYTQAM